MHSAHISFYQRYIKIINDELRNENSKVISKIEILPIDIIKMCCELPMWVLLTETAGKIFMINPGIKSGDFDTSLHKMEQCVVDKQKVTMAIITDPDTQLKHFLYFSR